MKFHRILLFLHTDFVLVRFPRHIAQ